VRYITVGLGFIIFVSSFSAVAEEKNQNDYGVSYGGSTGLAIRKTLSETSQIYAGIGLGYNHFDSSSCCNSNGNNYSLTLGSRHYLDVSKLSKFIDAELTASYQGTRGSIGVNSNSKGLSAYVAYGIEYFLSSNLSIEGKAGLSVDYYSYGGGSYVSKSTSTTFPRSSMAITYYW
jgi:hypothetical protein